MTNKKIDLDRNLFALAFSVMRCNWVPCGAAAVLLLVSNVGEGYLHAPLAFVVLRALWGVWLPESLTSDSGAL